MYFHFSFHCFIMRIIVVIITLSSQLRCWSCGTGHRGQYWARWLKEKVARLDDPWNPDRNWRWPISASSKSSLSTSQSAPSLARCSQNKKMTKSHALTSQLVPVRRRSKGGRTLMLPWWTFYRSDHTEGLTAKGGCCSDSKPRRKAGMGGMNAPDLSPSPMSFRGGGVPKRHSPLSISTRREPTLPQVPQPMQQFIRPAFTTLVQMPTHIQLAPRPSSVQPQWPPDYSHHQMYSHATHVTMLPSGQLNLWDLAVTLTTQ